MKIVEDVKKFVTGKTDIERKQESEANKIIRRKAIASALQERQRQEIKLAQEREKVSYERKIQQLRQPKQQGFFSGMSSFISPQTPAQQPQMKRQQSSYKLIPIKKGKKIISYKRVKIKKSSPKKIVNNQEGFMQRFDVVGSGNNNGKYRVI